MPAVHSTDPVQTAERRCKTCSNVKPISDFYMVKRPSGLVPKRECISCHSVRCRRNYRLKREERCRASREYYHKNKESVQPKRKLYYQNNKWRWREASRRRYAAHRGYWLNYYRSNKSKRDAQIAAWRIANKERYQKTTALCSSRRRARENNLPAMVSTSDLVFGLSYWRSQCVYCGIDLRMVGVVWDHYIPIAAERDNPGTVRNNLVPCCQPCNNSKKDRLPHEWLAREYGSMKAKAIVRAIESYFKLITEA